MRVLSQLARAFVPGALMAAVVVGCGGEPPDYDVSGTVTFAGKPVPKAVISFDPDVGKGAQGPPGYADAVDGAFDTRKVGKGVRGGPYRIRVSGFDGKPAYENPYGKPLFPEYVMTKDFPKEASTLTIDVPKPPTGWDRN